MATGLVGFRRPRRSEESEELRRQVMLLPFAGQEAVRRGGRGCACVGEERGGSRLYIE